MFTPQTYQVALALMILTMLCWGSWANTLKLCPGYRFQLFYWDYAIGLPSLAVFWGLTAGSHGHAGTAFLPDIVQAPLPPSFYRRCSAVSSSTSPTCCWSPPSMWPASLSPSPSASAWR